MALATQILRETDAFASAAVGYAGLTSQQVLAWRLIYGRPDAESIFAALLGDATPAGQLYALAGLRFSKSPLYQEAAHSLGLAGEVGSLEPGKLADLIVLDVTIVNDINGKSALLAGNDSGPFRWLSDHTYFWPFLQSQATWAKARAQGRDRVDTIDPPTNPAKYFPLDPQSDRWVERWNSILEINRLAGEKNVPVVLILFPLEFQVLDESYPTLPQEIFMANAAEAGIQTLDLLPAFRRACQEKPGGPYQLEDHYLFADVWMHPSAYGHSVTATELWGVLAGLLP